jgi:hypothetical protein
MSREHDQISFDLSRELTDFLERPACDGMTMLRPELEIMLFLNLRQAVLHQANRIGRVEDETTGAGERRQLMGRLNMNEVNCRPEELGQWDGVIHHRDRSFGKVDWNKDGTELE